MLVGDVNIDKLLVMEKLPRKQENVGGDPMAMQNILSAPENLHAIHAHRLGDKAKARNGWVGGEKAGLNLAENLDEGTNDYLRHLARMYRRLADDGMWDEKSPVVMVLEDMKLPGGKTFDGVVIRYTSAATMSNDEKAPVVMSTFFPTKSIEEKNMMRQTVTELASNPSELLSAWSEAMHEYIGGDIREVAPQHLPSGNKCKIIAMTGEWTDEETYRYNIIQPGDRYVGSANPSPESDSAVDQRRLPKPE